VYDWSDGKVFDAPLYLGYSNGDYVGRLGYSHPKIQHNTQNLWHTIGGWPHFSDYSNFNQGLYLYNGWNNPYTLWGR